MRKALKVALIALAVFIAAGVLFIVFFDWNSMRGWVSAQVEEKTGRKMTIETLDVRLGWHPTVRLTGVTLANPDWAEVENFIEAEGITARISVWPLIRGRLVIPYAEFVGTVIAMEKDGEDRSWDLKRDPNQPKRTPKIGQLVIKDGVVEYLDHDAEVDVAIDVNTDTEVANELVAQAEGSIRGTKAKASARGPALLLLEDASAPYPLRAEAQTGDTKAKIAGTITGMAELAGVDLDVELSGADLGQLAKLARVPLPDTPPYRLAGHVVKQDAEWRVSELQAKMGDSVLGGQLSVTMGERPLLKAKLSSDLIDFDDLGPVIGLPPKTTPGETASAEQKQRAQKMAAEKKSLPDKPINLGNWSRMDAEVELSAKRVKRAPALPIDSLHTRLELKNGVMRLNPLDFTLAGGTMKTNVLLDSRKPPLQGSLEASFSNLQLPKLFPTVKAFQTATGAVHGRAKLAGRGDAVGTLISSSDGRISLALNGGQISNLILELAGLDAAEAIRIFATRDKEIALRCAVADFDLAKGVAKTRALVFDTTDTVVIGEGQIDLGEENVGLTLYPRPKDRSILSFRAPLHVTGAFRDLHVRPDLKVLAARGLGALVLGAINPLLALAPLIETGPGKDSDCAKLLADARTWKQPEGSVASGKSEAEQRAAEAKKEVRQGPG